MPPEPLEYQGPTAIAGLLLDSERVRGAHLRLVSTRANGQPAFGSYLADAQDAIARAYSLIVLTLDGDRVGAITYFGDRGLFPHFGLPRTLPRP
jgi:RNA polymerase sigma-70 factor (ECF subfamily)